jgi:hypothetical protein
MSKDILVIPDQHAHPDHDNDRADWLGQYIKDTKPEIVINMGDAADMPSLSAYDKGKASFHGRNYEADINSHLDFQERMWAPIRSSKRKMPYRVVLIGNHEQRLKKVLEYQPELAGERYGVSFRNFDFGSYYNETVPYEGQTPGVYACEGINFAHFAIGGIMGRPISGEHHAYSLITKHYVPFVVAHSHTFDSSIRFDASGKPIRGLVCGVYQDYESTWAGASNRLWWRGVVHLRNVENGSFDYETIGIGALRREYGS